ncbi:Squalene epoxidase [Dissophora globulifera]|uniref:squalene monooxygenase n=1 Tax=Dissophora globulifera TaxID=979702 RepID=A0A9P6RIP9_9FUNG|nr:Squalene epoxidase [Dissophora globulifera]
MPGSNIIPVLATCPVPESGSSFDVIVIGGGVLGASFAVTFGKQGQRVLMIERDLSEPDRIVGELLQPGGYNALKELGLADCLEGIDAVPALGYGVIRGSEMVHIPYTKATANEILYDQDGVRATGVRCTAKKAAAAEAAESSTSTVEYKSRMVVIADGCFSKFRAQYLTKNVETTSHFVGLVLKDAVLPFPNHGHVVLATPSPILLYQISSTETRILIDIPGKLPSVSTGALRSYLETIIHPQLPTGVQKPFLRALETERLRSMPNSFLPPSTSSELGIIVLGDAMNMRHPLTGGGMTVALNDVVYLRDLLKDDALKDQEVTMVQMELFFWKRKELSAVINILAQALYALFAGTDNNLLALQSGCFSYFQMGGECIEGPVGLLSGLNRSRSTLIYHFYRVAFHSIWLLFHNASSVAEFPLLFLRALSIFWTACLDLILFPGDAELISVPQCTTGRVVVLQFKTSSQRNFFWLQEASTARDQFILEQVNTLIHTQEDEEEYLDEDAIMEGAEESAGTSTTTGATEASIAPSAAFAPAAPVSSSAAQPAGAAGGSSLTSQQMDQLRHLLGGIQVPQTTGGVARQSNLRLDHVLTPGAAASLLSNPQICQALFPHLPESSERTPEEIQAIVRTPQFSQALVSLSTALGSGQLGPLLRQFGLGPNAGDGVEGFLAAIEEQAKKEKK